MLEEILVTARHNPKIDPGLGIWTWEISVYLFLGGLTAGIIIFAALANLRQDRERLPFAANQLALWAPIVLSLGMTTLFLDLEHKLYVFRFYTTLVPSSPMSWGAWILIIIYPVSILQILSTLRAGYPWLAGLLERIPTAGWLLDLVERWRRPIAMVAIPSAVALGIYTGILLSAFSARPFWNSGLLGILFLVSGLSAGAAFAVLLARQHEEKRLFTRLDIGIIVVELAVVALLLINLATGPEQQIQALSYLLSDTGYAVAFWGLFIGLGLVIPLLIEFRELVSANRALAIIGPLLVLMGGYTLRHVTVELGQETSWTNYGSEFNTELHERLYDNYGYNLNNLDNR
jgi:formate-dependent nitrite reductase membrane component NrfD